MSILALINSTPMRCTKCGKECPPGAPLDWCGCWRMCACGWAFERNGGTCSNPIHRKTPTKPNVTRVRYKHF